MTTVLDEHLAPSNDVAKKKPPRKTQPLESEEPKRSQRSGEPLNVWIRSELMEALRVLVGRTRPRTTKTALVEEALEALLSQHGLWPPPPAGEE